MRVESSLLFCLVHAVAEEGEVSERGIGGEDFP